MKITIKDRKMTINNKPGYLVPRGWIVKQSGEDFIFRGIGPQDKEYKIAKSEYGGYFFKPVTDFDPIKNPGVAMPCEDIPSEVVDEMVGMGKITGAKFACVKGYINPTGGYPQFGDKIGVVSVSNETTTQFFGTRLWDGRRGCYAKNVVIGFGATQADALKNTSANIDRGIGRYRA